MKTRITSSGIVLRISSFVIFLFFITSTLAAQTWYNPSWLYRIPVTVSNPGVTDLSNFQVKINLDPSNFDFAKARNDGFDIRLTSGDGAAPIDFWVESWIQGSSASIWVKVPLIPPSGTTLFIYFGNASATSISNGTGTFDFFDDFESSSWAVTPRPNVWQDLAILPTPSADNTISVFDNKLYSFGGYGINHITLNTAYSFDPGTNGWSYLAPMPTSRWGMVSVEFNSKIYVFGGQDRYGNGVNQNEIYDPATDSWTSRALGNPLPLQNYGAEGVVHPDVIYFPGGHDGYEYWMAYTPFPPTSSENPAILRSHDGIRWTDVGISNPVIPKGSPGAWNDQENPDPDFIYVSALNKWFMVWDGGDATTDSRKIGLAYSTDGKTWTQYDGARINGNTNPVILSGDDLNGQTWERDGFGHSQTCTPSLFYEAGTFYLYYAEEASGNNRGQIGLATFTWNDLTDDVVDLQRNVGNPIISLPEDAIFKNGAGHLDVSKFPLTNTYRLYVVRELLGTGINYELSLLTSSSLSGGWVSQGKALERGNSGEWDDNHIYRSSPLVNSNGEIVVNTVDNTIRMFYSAFDAESYAGIGIADIYLNNGSVVKFSGTGPQSMPSEISAQGLMGVSDGTKIHLFYKSYHYVYYPLTDTYERILPDVPNPRTWATCAFVGGNIYLIGGYSDVIGSEGGTTENQMWNLSTNEWEIKSACPRSRYGATRENPVINGKIYATHGWNNYWFYTANYMYDPVTDTWTQMGSANHARDGVACGVINNKLYVVGGRNVPINTFGLIWNEVYDPTLDTWVSTAPPSTWNTSGGNFVYTDGSAKYQGDRGLVVRDPMDGSPSTLYSAETTQDFGLVYAVDFDWNVTTLGGISEYPTTYPETWVRLNAEIIDYGSLTFFEKNVPSLEWLRYPSYTHLQNSSWNSWHKVTVVRDGENNRVVFDGNLYPSLSMTPSGGEPNGPGRVRFGSIRTTQYLDNVRVRKWVGADPITVVGIEQNGTLNHWTGTQSSDWNNAGNWSSGSVPVPAENIAIFSASNYPVLPNLASVSCNNLIIEPSARMTVENGGILTVSGNLTINSVGPNNSGSLIVNGTLNTSPGAVTYNRYMPAGSAWHYVSSPLSLTVAPSGTFYGWNEVAGDWTPGTVDLPLSGVGYTLNTTGNSIAFTGSLVTSSVDFNATSPYRYNDVINGSEPNYNDRVFVQSADNSHSGPVTRSLSNYGGGGWNLLGNPYTSAISVASFISANYNVVPTSSQFDPNYVALYLYNGSTYYWVSNSTGWADGVELDQDYIQAGQGFFVLAMNDNSRFTFTRSMQEHSTSAVLLKSTGPSDRWPGFQLKARSGKTENVTTVVFNEGMNLGLDPGFDVGMMNSSPGAVIYTSLVKDNGVNFARQALPADGSIKNIIPVGIDFENGGEVTFSAEIEPLRTYKFILEDRVTGILTDLSSGSYTITLPAKTYGTGRFFVLVSTGRNQLQKAEYPNLLSLRIWSSQNNQVNIQGAVSENATCQVFDIRGHKILETRLMGSDYNTFTVPARDKGVYLVKVTDGTRVVTQKVIML